MSRTYIPQALRRHVRQQANESCEYCLIPETAVPESHHIDHIIPEAQGGPTIEYNLALACSNCNLRKGDKVVGYSDEWKQGFMLFNPRAAVWKDHFTLLPNGIIRGLTITGEATIKVLELNSVFQVGRREILLLDGVL